ncbi:MAG: ABC transporter permease [Alphaproteobacteria bacterium]|uniref:ABC transporter permease n=1 Tax=Candidatus Nitrobium versatile TaxID=2884831 RepID=A0A953SES9_9BACT|nr:ABC transporter permease [Candidatus Nitrobium versatile]
MRLVKLIRLLVLRNIREEKFMTLLSVIGVALGIGLFVGVRVASDRAIAAFEADIRGVHPHARYEILDISGIDFREEIYREVLRQEEDILPVLKTSGYAPRLGESLDINGIDTVRALRLLGLSPGREYGVGGLFTELNGVLISKGLADKHRVKPGETIRVLVYDREYLLKVIGVLDAKNLTPAMVVMDIGNYQEYFRRVGFLSRIDVATDEGTAERIRRLLPPHLTLAEKEELIRDQESLVSSFRYNLQFVSLISILVGMFLLYNTVFISVIKRRTEIGILRGLGAGKGMMVALFTVQGLILGGIGSAAGIFLGQGAAYFSVLAVEQTLSSMYRTVSLSDYSLTGRDALSALAIGLCVSLIASAVPAYESSRIRPHESAREGSFEGRYRKYRGSLALGGIACILSGGILSWADYYFLPFEFPFLAYAGILLLIVGFTLVSPSFLALILRWVRRPAKRLFRTMAGVTLGGMRGNVYRFSIALMSVAISSALIIALLLLIFSFRISLKAWIDANISADLYIKPASCASNFCFYPLSEEAVSLIGSLPGVRGVDRFRTLSLDFFGRKVVAGFADISLQREFSREGEEGRMLEEEQAVSISRYLSIRYGLQKGDILELMTPKGKKRFIVSDTFSSYSTTSGFIFLDRRWLREYWGLDDATQISVYLNEGVDTEQFARMVREKLAGRFSLEILNNDDLREKVLAIFNKSFAITYAIELISIAVSLIGVVNALLAFVLERQREISIVRYLGGDWSQIRQTLLLSAGVVGMTGILLGALMGPLMSLIFIHVVNKVSFGWEIRFSVPFLSLASVISVLFLTTLLAGLLPAKVARKIDPKKFISYE